MAGTLQTLNLKPPSTGSVPFRRRNPYFRATEVLSSGLHFVGIRNSSLRFREFRSISRKPIRAGESVCQENGGGDQRSRVLGFVKLSNWAKPLWNFLSTNFLSIPLICGVALGLANPSLGCLADRYSLSKFSTFMVFIISGLALRSEEIGAAAEAWPVGLLGLGSILFFTPFFSKLILQLQLQPKEFVTGLAIYNCMPTTLSSCVALTQLAGGNSALALALTLISNILGILIVPFSISKFIAAGIGVSVPTEQLLRSLVLTLLVPLILGKVIRESFKGLAEFADCNRKLLSLMSACLLGLVPLIQVSRSRSLLFMVKPGIFLVAVGMGALLHLLLLAFNTLAIRSLSAVSGGDKSIFARKQNVRTFIIVASQKTLPIMVAVVEQLGVAFGESGLLVLPCIVSHFNQIIMDSFLVSFWLQREQQLDPAKTA